MEDGICDGWEARRDSRSAHRRQVGGILPRRALDGRPKCQTPVRHCEVRWREEEEGGVSKKKKKEKEKEKRKSRKKEE